MASWISLPNPSPPYLAGLYINHAKKGRRIRVRFSSTEAGIHRCDNSKRTRAWVSCRRFHQLGERREQCHLGLQLQLRQRELVASGQPCVTQNRIFNKRQVDYPRTPAQNPGTYGNTMMKKQGIYGKILNTFIHEPIPIVNSVCFGGGIPIMGGLHTSKAVFPTTQCRYNLPIHAYTGTPMSRKFVICCCKGLPLLLVG
ncbi:LOW QUALITY PROTEIN: ribonuclease pancreatic beta-type-like [Dermochelys coriacea]|uniref:LOW QUALITY PROTEIN: ribonuclease pancreatic beta-type-like n=1 Tax=Dermochelys coriacea TaxID=27794 RepID=UPI001CA98A45|nr:LOW QUALITY PROTEIN: ribonuclease pancreatic beta-type-like [Dermochelys coriacea]